MHRPHSFALAIVLSASLIPRAAVTAQNDPKAAATAARAAAERAKAAAQAAAAASGDLRLRGTNGVLDVVRGSGELVFVYTAFGVMPKITLTYPPNRSASSTGGFFETTATAAHVTDGLTAAQKSDLIDAAKAEARAKAGSGALSDAASAQLPTFVRKELHFRPPSASTAPRDGYATVDISATDAGGATRELSLRVDVVNAPRRTGAFVDNFRVDGGFSIENAYLALALVDLGDKPEDIRRTKLDALGFETDTAALKDLGGEASDGFMVSNEDAVYIIFRGTNPSDIQSWVTDARVILDPASRYARSPAARIHRGFRTSFEQDFENRILTRLNGARDRGKPIVVIGHSLGAAMATVAAARLDALGKPVRAVYAFASPSVGNAEFKADYNSRLGQRHYRMINQEDIVPRLIAPPLYWAVGRLWYIDHKASHAIRALEFDDLDPEMTAHCALYCKPTTFLTRHRHLEYWAYLSQNMPASVDRSKLPPAPPMPR